MQPPSFLQLLDFAILYLLVIVPIGTVGQWKSMDKGNGDEIN